MRTAIEWWGIIALMGFATPLQPSGDFWGMRTSHPVVLVIGQAAPAPNCRLIRMAAAAVSGPSRRALVGTLMLGMTIVGVAAVIYGCFTSSAWLADRASLLAEVDVAVTETEIAHHQLAQALILATDLEAGITTSETLRLATELARRTLIDLPIDGVPELRGLSVAYTEAGLRLLERIESGDLAGARLIAEEKVIPEHDSLATSLIATRSRLLTDIDRARSINGLVATITGLIVVLLAPVAMVIVYRFLARRQLRRAELEAKLTAERELSRSKDEFIANISHELRTPLTSIYGFAHVLEQGSMMPQESASEILQVIITQAGELERMVDDLLVTARVNAGVLSYALEITRLEGELSEVVTGFERLHGPIPMDLEPSLVVADSLRLRQIMRNLIANAIKHGGSNVKVTGRTIGDLYELAVVDNGPGVPEQLADAMFERFMHGGRTPLVAGSVGLGLHIARSLAMGMGGDLEYRRRDGLTEFVLTLNLAPLLPAIERGDVVIHV